MSKSVSVRNCSPIEQIRISTELLTQVRRIIEEAR
jgi:hypothetical protein